MLGTGRNTRTRTHLVCGLVLDADQINQVARERGRHHLDQCVEVVLLVRDLEEEPRQEDHRVQLLRFQTEALDRLRLFDDAQHEQHDAQRAQELGE